MKLTNLIWVLALAGAAAACNSGPPITNEKPIVPPPTGGSSGGGGSGGIVPGEGACTTEENLTVYDGLVYTDEDGITYTGTDASSAIGSDCIFGTTTSDPVLPGCGGEAGNVIMCFPNCPQETIDIAASCVSQCTQDATGLSEDCVACTGDTVACGAAFCTLQCIADSNAPACIDCRCANNCIQSFEQCSGLPSDDEC